jgi:hypothetical protein
MDMRGGMTFTSYNYDIAYPGRTLIHYLYRSTKLFIFE